MFCGRFEFSDEFDFVAMGETPEAILNQIHEGMMQDGAFEDADLPPMEDIQFFQCWPVMCQSKGYQFFDPDTEELVE